MSSKGGGRRDQRGRDAPAWSAGSTGGFQLGLEWGIRPPFPPGPSLSSLQPSSQGKFEGMRAQYTVDPALHCDCHDRRGRRDRRDRRDYHLTGSLDYLVDYFGLPALMGVTRNEQTSP
jgi:hypothetical protein